MTSTVTESTLTIIRSNAYDGISATFGAITIVLLVILLIEKELIRAYGGQRTKEWLYALDLAIMPLLLVFGSIAIIRIYDLYK